MLLLCLGTEMLQMCLGPAVLECFVILTAQIVKPVVQTVQIQRSLWYYIGVKGVGIFLISINGKFQ